MNNLRQKITIIVIICSFVGIAGALTSIFNPKAYNKVLHYRPYSFTERDQAELTVMKFIRAFDNGDIKNLSLLMDKDLERHKICKVLEVFYTDRKKDKNLKHLIIQPKKFIFNDSTANMICKLKNLAQTGEIEQCVITVVKRETNWLISSSSDFFEILKDKDNKKEDQKLGGAR